MNLRFSLITVCILVMFAQSATDAQVVTTVPGQTYISVVGDPAEQGGMCDVNGICINTNKGVPFDYFATSADVSTINTNLNSLDDQMTSLNNSFADLSAQISADALQTDALLNRLLRDDDRNRTGVAMSFAMAGVADLAPGERVAVSGNWGTFAGRNGVAAGVAVRVSERLSFNGGIATGLNGGTVGGRAGFRVAW